MGILADGLRSLLNRFIDMLPENADRQTGYDQGNVSKTSPWLFDYDVFKINWEKVATLREIDVMIKGDTRLKRANHVFATTAVRRGISVKASSDVSETLGQQAQDALDEMLRSCQINSKLLPWGRSLLKDGELYLNPIIDPNKKLITDIKNLPAISMQRNENIKGRFDDLNDAFRQIDPVSREILTRFPLWAVNHIRYDHESGQLYGNSQYLACRALWKKLTMLEEDLVVRRRTRAVPRRLHIVGNKDNPGDWAKVQEYKEKNKLDNPKLSTVTTDYFGNGLTDIKDLNADAQLDHIKDVEYALENMMIGTGVPLHILGFGQNVNRDIVEDQKKQFNEDCQEVRDLLEYGDESPFSGLRALFDLQLALRGIDPTMIDINIMWADTDNDTVDQKVDRVAKLRSAQPSPLMSQKFAMMYLGRDIGLENEAAVDEEIANIQAEIEADREAQQAMAAALNPSKESTSPNSSKRLTSAPVKDDKETHPLRTGKVLELEKHSPVRSGTSLR